MGSLPREPCGQGGLPRTTVIVVGPVVIGQTVDACMHHLSKNPTKEILNMVTKLTLKCNLKRLIGFFPITARPARDALVFPSSVENQQRNESSDS
jgi:hypothetical protein